MSILPVVTTVSARYKIPLFLILIALGLVGNYFRFPLLLDIDFLFGSIFAMLALQLLGLGRGIAAAAMIASLTYMLWNHPYAIIIMTAEVAIVGSLMERRKMGMVLADMLYWLVIGMPLVFLFYHLVMHVPPSNTFIIMTKQAVNGITNALIARLIFTVYNLRARSALTPYREVTYNLMAFFVLCPVLIMIAIESRIDFNETDRRIRTQLIQARASVGNRLEAWAEDRLSAIVNLAEMAASRTPQEMQPFLELIKKSDVNFPGVGLLDQTATTTAYFPLVDDQGVSTIGIRAPDRPYLSVLKQTLKPMLSEVLMGRAGIPKPRVFVLAPVVVRGEFDGYAIGVLSLEQIRDHLEDSSKNTTLLYTLLDKQDNVIMSNRSDQTIMTPFVRSSKGTLNQLDTDVNQWVPVVPANTPISERWKQSFYVAETTIGKLAEWKLLIEQPVAPFQKILYDNYTGKLTLLFLVLLGALVLAEFLSRRFVSPIEKLRLITNDLPIQLATNEGEITWPESGILETNHLVHNFRKMAIWLTAQFNENRQINESLEQRVEERTSQLAESEKRYRSILDKSPVPMAINDEQQNVVFLNPAFIKTFGYTLEDIPTLNCWWPQAYPDPIYQQEVAEAWQKSLEAAKQTGDAFSPLEVTVRCKNLTNKTVLIAAASFSDTSIKDHLVVLYDITERKRSEAALKNSEEQLQLAIWGADLGMWDWNIITGEVKSNARWAEMLGYSVGELEPNVSSWENLLHPDDVTKVSEALKAHLEGRSPHYETEHRLLGKSGEYIWILDKGRITHRDKEGCPLRAAGIHQDITERKQIEKELQQSETRLNLALTANQNAVWDWDLLANELYYSPYWWNMIGYEENELEADPDLWRRLMHPDDLDRANLAVSEALKGAENSFQIETRLLHKNGHCVPVLTRGFILRDNNANPVRVSGTNTDLTERKIVEEGNRQLAQQLQQLEKTESLHRMAGAIAHTFNNLLGATMGYLDMAIEDLPSDGSSSKFLASALQATERAADVSSMMLTYLGQSFVEQINLDLSEVCRSSLVTLKGLIKKDVVLASDFPSSGPVVVADASQVQRLLKNLVLNASEAIQDEQGTITLIIRTVSLADIPTARRFPIDWQPQGDHFACLMVKDTGEGVAAKDIDKLFDPFFTSKFAGRGLGLAIVLGILRMQKGLITVESEPGRGSVFQVYLPISMEHISLEQDTSTQSSAIGANHAVLLVEDEQPMREMAEAMLTRLGFVVFAAKDSIEAIEIFREHQDDMLSVCPWEIVLVHKLIERQRFRLKLTA